METLAIRFSAASQPEICLKFDAVIPREDIAELVSFFEQSVDGGARYRGGELIELRSMILRIVPAEGGLSIEEPDLCGVPISWAPGVTQSLRLLRLQKDVAESVRLGAELNFPTIRQSLIFGIDLGAPDALVLERCEPADHDSGWFVGRLDSELDYNQVPNLRRISVYEAILGWPRIAGFLALPPGSRVELSARARKISRNGKALAVQEGGFLPHWNGRVPGPHR